MNDPSEMTNGSSASGPVAARPPGERSRDPVVFPRLLIGWIILICAEVFSGASLGVGLWNPWTLVVTYWLYLLVLYGVTYVYLRPEGLPSVPVQLFTFVFYAVAIAGIFLHRRREPLPITASRVQDRELRLVKILFALMLILALVFSVSALRPIVIVPIVVNFIIWTILGFLLTWVAFNDGVWERLVPAEPSS